jgi:hypothetical protein
VGGHDLVLAGPRVAIMAPDPLPSRVAVLEERTARIDRTVSSIDSKVDALRDLIAERRGSERAATTLRHIITIVISGIGVLISVFASWRSH